MRRLTAATLIALYLALAPLCTSGGTHAQLMSHDTHATHQDTHAARDVPTSTLPYHADMYTSFTSAIFLAVALLLFFGLAAILGAISSRLMHVRVSVALRQIVDRPPDPLLRRLMLYTHAPPRLA